MARFAPSKYEPLRAYLAAQPAAVGELTLTFAELERIVGAALPATARRGQFWTNHPGDLLPTPPARAWWAAGWRVARLDLRARPAAVTFARGAPPVS